MMKQSLNKQVGFEFTFYFCIILNQKTKKIQQNMNPTKKQKIGPTKSKNIYGGRENFVRIKTDFHRGGWRGRASHSHSNRKGHFVFVFIFFLILF
jgi:hypothetical protein